MRLLSAVQLHHLLAQRSREYGLGFLLYGALNFAQISRGVRTGYSCCTVLLILAQISRKVQLSLLLYGLLINCTDIEEVYGQSAAVRTAFIGTNSKEMYGLVLLFSCI